MCHLNIQNDDITGQLMHGVRYLDIRIGYYRGAEPKFWVNHGISRQQPLIKVLQQVREFVLETNEIVIFDVQEFPVGESIFFIIATKNSQLIIFEKALEKS